MHIKFCSKCFGISFQVRMQIDRLLTSSGKSVLKMKKRVSNFEYNKIYSKSKTLKVTCHCLVVPIKVKNGGRRQPKIVEALFLVVKSLVHGRIGQIEASKGDSKSVGNKFAHTVKALVNAEHSLKQFKQS